MKSKKPSIFLICCCDNRIMPYDIVQKEPGELFVLRNIGNIIPPHGDPDSSVAAAIEYAVGHLAIPEIIVCGHSDCGGMKANLEGVEEVSRLGRWLTHALQSKPGMPADDLSRDNVRHQIKNLKTYSVVQKALAEGKLAIHGWWVDLEKDEVLKNF